MNRLVKMLLVALCLLASTLAFAQAQEAYDSWNGDSVFNNPPIYPIVTIFHPWEITKIGDYHFNNGAGKDPATIHGKISIYNNTSGALIGSWTASTAENTSDLGGACLGPNMCWAAYPNVILQPGTYKIVDSDPSSWSYTTTNLTRRGSNWAPNQGFSFLSGTPPASIGTIILNETRFGRFGTLSFPFKFDVPQLIVLCEFGVTKTTPARCVRNVVSDIISVTNNTFGKGVVAMSSDQTGSLRVPVDFPLPPPGSPTIVLRETGQAQELAPQAGLPTTNPNGSHGPKIRLTGTSDLEISETTISDILTVSTQ